MRSFEYYTPTKVIFGKDTHLKIGEILKDYNCHKILIHYGGKSAVKSGLIDDIKKCLTDAGFDFVTLGGVVPNPRLSKVREGIALCREKKIDFIEMFKHADEYLYEEKKKRRKTVCRNVNFENS